jgi:hypothetical protein
MKGGTGILYRMLWMQPKGHSRNSNCEDSLKPLGISDSMKSHRRTSGTNAEGFQMRSPAVGEL